MRLPARYATNEGALLILGVALSAPKEDQSERMLRQQTTKVETVPRIRLNGFHTLFHH